MRYHVQKRVANTDHWVTVEYSDDQETADRLARRVVGGDSTGVRIIDNQAPADDPRYIRVVRGV